mgnify:CR=1 FL=1|tara:strand:- start:27 stop:191 length:165 start_codon:yes stop_codon:yes gene_type:complete
MVVEYKILLDEEERDMLLDLIEHRMFLLKFDKDRDPNDITNEMTILTKIGDRLT